MNVEESSFFATCPRGMEDLLAKELENLSISDYQITVGAVYFNGPLRAAYALCLWSRVANRVMLQLNDPRASPPIATELALYTAVSQVSWEEHMSGDTTFAVDFIGTNEAINNTQFGAVRVKDAVVDRMRTKIGRRPDVDRQQPQLRIQARLAKGQLQLGLDLSGTSLHQRGYRLEQGAAPLKENLAAGILLRLGWPEMAKSGAVLVDPMCGSGTLLIEAALIAKNIAPGLLRMDSGSDTWGFTYWLHHQPEVWRELVDQARNVQAPETELRFWGADENAKILQFARANAARAGVEGMMGFSQSSLVQFQRPAQFSSRTGLLVCNPPYGERLGEFDTLKQTYLELAEISKKHFPGWQLAVFTGNPDLAREMRLRPKRINKFLNGTIPCELLLYDLLSVEQATLRRDRDEVQTEDLSEGAQMVANRLRKNLRKLVPWLKNANTNAYRVYDADLPEYAAAVDLYNGQVHVQEYAAPKTINEDAAQRRLRELISAVAHVFAVSPARIALKTRQRNKGKQQYEKIQNNQDFFVVEEGAARYWVNLRDYLDTGLFLDHRPLRRMIYEQAHAQRFLNLFCYTASASVQAVLGGASQTVSVDMSHTYLDWAKRNFELNNIRSSRHELIQEDCLKWLDQCRQGFDLIMLDPPTFSNSKRMEGVLDIQRDHVVLVRRCMELLNPGGKLYFSTNLRTFKCDFETLSEYDVKDISASTLDEDFSRNPKIHHCFLIQHLQDRAP